MNNRNGLPALPISRVLCEPFPEHEPSFKSLPSSLKSSFSSPGENHNLHSGTMGVSFNSPDIPVLFQPGEGLYVSHFLFQLIIII